LVPARLERLPWGRFHVLVIFALGITWILDGLEVTLSGSVGPALKTTPALEFTDQDVGATGSVYLVGAVFDALFFGWLTDRLGRKRLFFTTIAVYLTATALTGLAWSPWSFFLFRFLTGAGIGGEYAAINSTIQGLIPARFRGQLDLTINGSFWVGAALGAVVAASLLDPAHLGPDLGWRFAFLVGAGLGMVVFAMRMWIPESPRWLVIHGREQEPEETVAHPYSLPQGERGVAPLLAMTSGPGIILDAPDRRLPRLGEHSADLFDLAKHPQNIARGNFFEVAVGEAAADELGEQIGEAADMFEP
jgi:MFS family permease